MSYQLTHLVDVVLMFIVIASLLWPALALLVYLAVGQQEDCNSNCNISSNCKEDSLTLPILQLFYSLLFSDSLGHSETKFFVDKRSGNTGL